MGSIEQVRQLAEAMADLSRLPSEIYLFRSELLGLAPSPATADSQAPQAGGSHESGEGGLGSGEELRSAASSLQSLSVDSQAPQASGSYDAGGGGSSEVARRRRCGECPACLASNC